MLPTHQYTLSAIETILYSGFQPRLLTSVIDIINRLNNELQVPEETPVSASTMKRDAPALHDREKERRKYGNKRDQGKNNRAKPHNEVSSEEWDAMMAATAASVISQKNKEGLEKNLNNIRILMNKISTKNYETQKTALHTAIETYIQESNGEDEDISKLFKNMIDIIGTNKFFSELYATLFKEWFDEFPVFSRFWEAQLDMFIHSIDDIHSVDSNVDYDGYCNYTKINDKRKAYTTFVGNLCKKGAISDESVCRMLGYYLQKTLEYMDEKGRTVEVEEITENVYILTQLVHSKLTNNEIWQNNISPILISISQMKMKEHVSLSNRTVFKYMDIIENMEL